MRGRAFSCLLALASQTITIQMTLFAVILATITWYFPGKALGTNVMFKCYSPSVYMVRMLLKNTVTDFYDTCTRKVYVILK